MLNPFKPNPAKQLVEAVNSTEETTVATSDPPQETPAVASPTPDELFEQFKAQLYAEGWSPPSDTEPETETDTYDEDEEGEREHRSYDEIKEAHPEAISAGLSLGITKDALVELFNGHSEDYVNNMGKAYGYWEDSALSSRCPVPEPRLMDAWQVEMALTSKVAPSTILKYVRCLGKFMSMLDEEWRRNSKEHLLPKEVLEDLVDKRKAIIRTPKPLPKDYKSILFHKQKGQCAHCEHELPEHVLTVDHIVPKSKGGPHIMENLQLLCNSCNSKKGNKLD